MSSMDVSRTRRWNRSRLDLAARAIVRLFLAACPADFRERFGTPLVETFQDRLDEAFRRRGWPGWVQHVVAESWNLLLCASRLRLAGSRQADRSLRGKTGKPGFSGSSPLGSMAHDLRSALRTLARHPFFAGGIVLLLAFGIGLNTATFSVLNTYLLKPLPFPGAERLMSVRNLPLNAPASLRASVPAGLFEIDWPVPPELAEEVVSWDLDSFTLVGEGRPEVLVGAWVTPGYVRALGTRPVLGRGLLEADGEAGAAAVAMISHELWQRRFGGDPEVVGKTISAYTSDRPDDAESFTIIGVLPRDFWFIHSYTEILTNLRSKRQPYLLKLREGVDPKDVETYLNGLVRSQIQTIDPSWPGLSLVPTQEFHVSSVRPILFVLFAAAGLVLLIACANVAMLLTVRAFGRQRELSVRRALGASRLRIARELCLEGLILAGLAGCLGIGLASATLSAFGHVIESQLRTSVPGGIEALRVGGTAVILTLLASGATALIFAILPALAATSRSLARCLVESGTSSSHSRSQLWLRNLVIGGEIAISLVLLIGAALMLQSAVYLVQIDLGFIPERILTANLSIRQQDYRDERKLVRLVDSYLNEIRALPGVTVASMVAGWPFQDRRTGPVTNAGLTPESAPRSVIYLVGGDYFRTLSIPLLAGREFGDGDRFDSEPVVILSQDLARQLWPQGEPLGKQVRLGLEGPNAPWRTVVGISRDIQETLTGENYPDSYLPLSQSPHPFLFLIAHIAVNRAAVVPSLEDALWKLDSTAALSEIWLMDELISRQRTGPQFLAMLLSAFTLFATVLALVGLYAIVSYAVGQRSRDIAVRMALGADQRSVVRLFVGRALSVISGGVLAGALGSLALSSMLSSQLFGVTSLDLTTYLLAIGLLTAAALLAVWFPARRASLTDPVRALRGDI